MSAEHRTQCSYSTAEDDFYRQLWSTEEWGQSEPNGDEHSRLEAIRRLLRKYFVGRKPTVTRVLDLGCGRGWLSNRLLEIGSVIGIDPSPSSIEIASSLFPEIRFQSCGGDQLVEEVGEGYFDLVVSSEVIEHVADGDKAGFASTILRLLKPRGVAILTTPEGKYRRSGRSRIQTGNPWKPGYAKAS